MSKLIGLSVSFCIRDICEGNVALEDVSYIIPGFNVVQNPEQIFNNYKDIYWRKNPNALEILRKVTLKYINSEILAAFDVRRCDYTWIKKTEFNEKVRVLLKKCELPSLMKSGLFFKVGILKGELNE